MYFFCNHKTLIRLDDNDWYVQALDKLSELNKDYWNLSKDRSESTLYICPNTMKKKSYEKCE